MIVYKALNHGKSPYRHFKWPTPQGKRRGAWVEVEGKPVLCANGLHGFLRREDAERAGSEVYEMELAGDIVKDGEKAAGTKGRLLRKLWAFGPEGPIEKGLRTCKKCGRPHDSYIVTKGVAPQWSDLKDGHLYQPEDWDTYAARQKSRVDRIEAYRLARREAQKQHAGPGTYQPVVPAYHAFKTWTEQPDRCGTCGLSPDLHRGWQKRAKLADEFMTYDRWELLLVIQELQAA